MIRRRFSYDEELCRKYVQHEEDVAVISKLAENLPMFAELLGVNVFIDCPTEDPDVAIVVAEAFPQEEDPLYENSVLGYKALRENEPGALRTLSMGVITKGAMGFSQELFPIRQVCVPIFGKEKNKPIGVLIRESRGDSEQRAEEKLAFIQEASSSFTDAVYSLSLKEFDVSSQMREGIVLFDDHGRVTYYNRGAAALYQKLECRKNLMGASFEEIALTGDTFESYLESPYEVREVVTHECTFEIRYTQNRREQKDKLCMLIRDVTEKKKYEKELRLQTFLVSEMNHRIKNNLQTVASILNIQSHGIQDPEIRQMFFESVNRIRSIAEVHNQLSLTKSEEAELVSLTKRICVNVAVVAEMDYHVSGEEVTISAGKASALGLIINELVQNVAKHACPPNGGRKAVWIDFGLCGNLINVDIRDNGAGFVPGAGKNLGLMLVERLLKEPLGGKMEIKNYAENTIISLEFPR